MTEPAFEAAEVEVSVWRGVGIARDAALKPTVPHSVTSPLRGFGLTDGNGLAATTVDVRWGDPRLLLVSGGREVVERVPESPLGLSPSSSDGMMSRMARQAGAVIEGGRVLEQFARYRGGRPEAALVGPTVQEGVPPRDALERRGDGSLVQAEHAPEGVPRRSSASVSRPMGHALRGGGAEVELGAVGGGVCSARWLGHGTLPWWRKREGRRRSEGYPGAGVGARGTLGRREGASRGGGVSGAPRPALGAGAADRVRYGCKVDRSREEFGFGEILASHEDHVGSGNEGRAEHLELAERGGPGGPRRASGTGRAWRTGWSPRCAGDRCAAVEAPDERGRPP